MWTAAEGAAHVGTAALGALGFAVLSYFVESSFFIGFTLLERAGILERLAPEVKGRLDRYQRQTFLAFFGSIFPVLLLVGAIKPQLLAIARPDYRPLPVLAFVWTMVALHDAWFYLVHSFMHKHKRLYRWFHSKHHMSESSLTVYATADMDVLEAFVLFFGFYGLLLAHYWRVGAWNPVAFTALVLTEASMNMAGHCGYRLPMWLWMLLTSGIAITPGAASPKSHYIHHIDARVNRALYFTWWDRLAGTFQGSHRLVKEYDTHEALQYEARVVTVPLRKLRQAVLNWGYKVAVD